jgi:pimeloyl-ACP methyl ester carboxylesterase
MGGTDAAAKTGTVKVPGATLYYEVRGAGPVLLCIPGGPTDAGMFTDLAERLAGDFTVVAYDPRGHSRSPLDGEPEDVAVSLQADDAAAILSAMGSEPAYVYGNSGGGTIGVELVTRHPDQVGTLVSHEAPIMELLPDAEEWRGRFEDITKAYETGGAFAGMGVFGAAVEVGGPKYSEEMQQSQEPPTPEAQEMMARMMGNFDQFIGHEIREFGAYVPDVDALKAAPTRIVSAAGETSGEQGARRSAIALAERLDIPVTPLPGAHGGWGSDPQEFADRLRAVLKGAD